MVKIPLRPALNSVFGHIVVKIRLRPALNSVLGHIVAKSGREARRERGKQEKSGVRPEESGSKARKEWVQYKKSGREGRSYDRKRAGLVLDGGEGLADLALYFFGQFYVVLHQLFHGFTALSQLGIVVGEPGAGLLDDAQFYA